MPAIEIVSTKEQKLWDKRTAELKEHASYQTKQQYFPRNMDEWEEKGKEIEQRYRAEMLSLNKMRKEEEERKESIRPTIKRTPLLKRTGPKKNNITTPTIRQSIRQAAQALLDLKNSR